MAVSGFPSSSSLERETRERKRKGSSSERILRVFVPVSFYRPSPSLSSLRSSVQEDGDESGSSWRKSLERERERERLDGKKYSSTVEEEGV